MKKQQVLMIVVGVLLIIAVAGIVVVKSLANNSKDSDISRATIAVLPSPTIEAEPEATGDEMIGEAATLNANESSDVKVTPKKNVLPSAVPSNKKVTQNTNTNTNVSVKVEPNNQVTDATNVTPQEDSAENSNSKVLKLKIKKDQTTATLTVNQDGKAKVVVKTKDQQEKEETTNQKVEEKKTELENITNKLGH